MSENEPQSILVLGATGSIGGSVVRLLSQQGHRVVAAGRNAERLNTLAEDCDVPTFQFDAADAAAIASAAQFAAQELGAVTGVANCIGSVLLKPGHLTTEEEWSAVIETNLTSGFRVLRGCVPLMRKSGGSIVFVSSAAARIGINNHEAIAAAKAGLNGLTLSAAATYARQAIRVNSVAPGLVRSEMTRHLWENEASLKVSDGMHAMGRIGNPEDVAELISWLLGPHSSWITGQIIGADGGLGSLLPRQRH